jgi:hypothetical protein
MKPAMDNRTLLLRDSVAEQEAEFRGALQQLESAARRALELRNWMESHPWLCLSGAMLLGAWLGGRRR